MSKRMKDSDRLTREVLRRCGYKRGFHAIWTQGERRAEPGTLEFCFGPGKHPRSAWQYMAMVQGDVVSFPVEIETLGQLRAWHKCFGPPLKELPPWSPPKA